MLSPTHALVLASLLLVCGSPASAADEMAAADVELLTQLDLPADGPGLVDFFKKRTLREADKPKIEALIRKLGDDDFDTRETAMREIIALGAALKPLLREAIKKDDIELVRRAEKCLALAEKTATPEVLSAAVRQLGRKPAPGAAQALLDFLPFVEHDLVIEEYGLALARTGVPGGKPEPILLQALAEKQSVRRAVVAEALGRAAASNEELRRAARNLLMDADVQVRRRAALGLLAAKDREAVPVLINLLAELPTKQTYRIEETLYDLAGDKPPTFAMGRADEDGRKKYRDAWLTWWKEHGAKIDVAKLGVSRPYLGYTLVSCVDFIKGRQIGRVYELDADGKERWSLDNIQYPQDAQVLPNGNILVCEQSGQLLTERTPKGEIVRSKKFPSNLIGARRLHNGNTFIATRNQLMEVDKDDKEVWTINRTNNDVLAAQRLSTGGVAMLSNTSVLLILDEKGKELKQFSVGQVYSGAQFEVLPGGRILIPNYNLNKVIEYDAEGRKTGWECNAIRPTCVQRLPNGNTLISSRINTSIIEVDRAGKEVWSHNILGGRNIKASRR